MAIIETQDYQRLVEEVDYLLFKKETATSIKEKNLIPALTAEEIDYIIRELTSAKAEKAQLDWGNYGFEIAGAAFIMLGIYCYFIEPLIAYFFVLTGVSLLLKRLFLSGLLQQNSANTDRNKLLADLANDLAMKANKP